MLLEHLKKDQRKGMKELIVNEFIENEDFKYEDGNSIEIILDKIKDFIDETKWNKTVKLVKEFRSFKQDENEKNRDYVTRFNTFETRMKNTGTELPKMWLAAEMMTRSNLNHLQKHNIMATVETEDTSNILAVMKKKLKDIDGCETDQEPKKAFYVDNRTPGRNFSRDNRYGNERDRRNRSFSRHDRNRSSSRSGHQSYRKDGNRDRRPSFHKDASRERRPSFHKDGERRNSYQKAGNENSNPETATPKRTYHVTLKMDSKRSIFENEVENKALVDSGCPELVAGLSWLKTYESSRGYEFKKVNRKDTFKMGNNVFNTVMFKKIPIRIGKHEEEIEVGIINTEIPLLISKKKLKEWGGKIDFQENTLFLRNSGETVQMEETSSGHLVINLAKDLDSNKEEAIQELFLMKQTKQYNMKDLKKLHRVFGHPTEDKLKKLMDDAGIEDPTISRILKKIHETCRICQKYRKKQSKPKTALPKARFLNEAVSLDLKPLSSLLEDPHDKRHIVYIMDEFSRFTVASIAKSKEPEVVAKIVLDDWCLKGIGYPKGYFFCDNGSEFKGNLLESLAKRTGIKVKLTPSYSAWSNGGIERKHGAINLTIKKMMEDDKNLKIEDALKHSVWSRNMEIGKFGYSPYQLVYGESPFLPGISEGNVLTDQSIQQEDIIRQHFLNQEKARIMMRKAEANNRLKEALNSRIQPYHDIVYQPGDIIIYLNKDDKWDGPAKVAACESKTLHILQNGTMRKIATLKARPWNENSVDDDVEISEEDAAEDSSQEEESRTSTTPSQLEQRHQPNAENATEEVDLSSQEEESRPSATSSQLEQSHQPTLNSTVSIQEEQCDQEITDQGIDDLTDSTMRLEMRPKRGSRVKYRFKGSDEVHIARVKSVGKKMTAKRHTCWMENENSSGLQVIDFGKEIDSWDYVEKSKVSFLEAGNKVFLAESNTSHEFGSLNEKEMESHGVFLLKRKDPIEVLATMVHSSQYNDPEVKQAMEAELEKWNQFQAYEIVDDDGQERIDGRWVINKKEEHDGLKVNIKARYCLRGFKESNKPRSDSPTVDRVSTKLLYAIAGNEGWKMESVDVTSAFLQGSDLDRDIFVTPPKEAGMDGYLWKMKKAAYGLYDAGRRWWIKVMEVLKELGGKTLVGDESLVVFHVDGKLSGLIGLHVDDFQATGNDDFFAAVMDQICLRFKISKREIHNFRFTGVDVSGMNDGNVIIFQESYSKALQKINVDINDDPNRPLTRSEFKSYRGLVGQLTWLSEMTRPDLSYDTLDLASYNKDATIKNLRMINKIVDKAKKIQGSVRYSRIGEFSDLKILAISDGGLNRRDNKTQSVMGKTIFLSNKAETKVAPLLWKAKTIQTVCKSAKTAETRACDKTLEDAIYLARCVHEIYTGERGERQIPVDAVTDSQSLLDSIESTKQVEEKLMRPVIKWIKQVLDSGAVQSIRWCDTCVCVSDAFTKPGSKLNQTLVDIFQSGRMIDLSFSTKR